MRLSFFLTLLLCWIPYGLIHQAQRKVNPKADPIVGTYIAGPSCTPLTWRKC